MKRYSKIICLLVISTVFIQTTSAQSKEYIIAMNNPELVASYRWWKYVNPHNYGQPNFTDTGIVAHSKRTELKMVNWFNNRVNLDVAIGNDSLVHLKAMKNLEKLMLRGNIDDYGLMYVALLTSLTNLTISDVGAANYNITDKGIRALSSLTNMKVLDNFPCANVTDNGLSGLSSWAKLTSLNLKNWNKITNAGLTVSSQWPNLTRLLLGKTAVTTGVLPTLVSNLKNLTYLDLEFNNINDKVWTYIPQFKYLQELVIGHTQLTDKGERMMIDAIHATPTLSSISLFGCGMSAAAIKRVKEACPTVAIYF